MDDLYFLLEIFDNIDIYLLILVRLIGFFMIMPIFVGLNMPGFVRIGFAALFAHMVYFSGIYGNVEIYYYDSILGYFLIAVKEFFVGFTMAYVVYLVFSTMYIVGHFIDDAIGFSMLSIFDPMSQIQVAISGNLLYMLFMVMLILTGGLNSILAVLFQSFEFLPIGRAVFLGNGEITLYILHLTIFAFYLGVQIAMPIIGTFIIINVSLGILVKAVPQMNVFVVGMPLKLLIGLILLYLVFPVIFNTYFRVFEEAYRAIVNVMGSLS